MTQELCLNLFNICDLETIKGVRQFMELVIDFNNNIIRNIKVLPHIQLYLASGEILFDDKLNNNLIKILSDCSKKFYIIYKNEKYKLLSTLLMNLDKDEDVHTLTLLFINEEKILEWFYCDDEYINSILLYYEKKYNIKMINIIYVHHTYGAHIQYTQHQYTVYISNTRSGLTIYFSYDIPSNTLLN
jgi:hypothetical protein